MESYWQKTETIKDNAPLSEVLNCDAAVIGAGMAGLLTAYRLSNSGKNVIVLDASQTGGGQTKNTTAKITSQNGLIYHKLIRHLGIKKARQYADANQMAIEEYYKIIQADNISCDFNFTSSCLYACNDTAQLILEKEAAEKLGIECSLIKENELPFETAGTLLFTRQAEFHPLKFLKAISEKLTIFNNCKVTNVENNTIYTDKGRINARHIIFACHYPFINIPGYYFLRMYQERSYVLALKNTSEIKKYIDGECINEPAQSDLKKFN